MQIEHIDEFCVTRGELKAVGDHTAVVHAALLFRRRRSPPMSNTVSDR